MSTSLTRRRRHFRDPRDGLRRRRSRSTSRRGGSGSSVLGGYDRGAPASSGESSSAKDRCSGVPTCRDEHSRPLLQRQLAEAVVMAQAMDEDTLERGWLRFWDRDADSSSAAIIEPASTCEREHHDRKTGRTDGRRSSTNSPASGQEQRPGVSLLLLPPSRAPEEEPRNGDDLSSTGAGWGSGSHCATSNRGAGKPARGRTARANRGCGSTLLPASTIRPELQGRRSKKERDHDRLGRAFVSSGARIRDSSYTVGSRAPLPDALSDREERSTVRGLPAEVATLFAIASCVDLRIPRIREVSTYRDGRIRRDLPRRAASGRDG